MTLLVAELPKGTSQKISRIGTGTGIRRYAARQGREAGRGDS